MMMKKQQREKKKKIVDSYYNEQTKKLENIMQKIDNLLKNKSADYEYKIKNNPEFRTKFANLCNILGIDPIITKKSMWSSYSEFYTQLGMKILRICEKSKKINGGIISIEEIIKYNNKFSKNSKVNKEDILSSLKNLEFLGTGVKVINNEFISTSPFSLSQDVNKILAVFKQYGKFNYKLLKNQGWSEERFRNNILKLTQEGLIWRDGQTDDGVDDYYFPEI